MATCYLETHPVSNRTRSHNTVQEVLKPLSYRYDEAVGRFTLVLTHFYECDERQHTFDEWTRLDLSNLEAQVREEAPETSDALKKYFEIFNRMFFSNGLNSDHCTLEFIGRAHPQFEAGEGNQGTASRGENTNPTNAWSHIKIYEQGMDSASERLAAYIGTLLHEMIHSYLQVYTCMCKTCRKDKYTTRGHTGHGLPW